MIQLILSSVPDEEEWQSAAMFGLLIDRVKTKLYHSRVNWNCQVEGYAMCVRARVCVYVRWGRSAAC